MTAPMATTKKRPTARERRLAHDRAAARDYVACMSPDRLAAAVSGCREIVTMSYAAMRAGDTVDVPAARRRHAAALRALAVYGDALIVAAGVGYEPEAVE